MYIQVFEYIGESDQLKHLPFGMLINHPMDFEGVYIIHLEVLDYFLSKCIFW